MEVERYYRLGYISVVEEDPALEEGLQHWL